MNVREFGYFKDAIVAQIDAHIPSLSDEDDAKLDELRFNTAFDRLGMPEVDNADLAIRTCRCGEAIDGFYEYVDHLKEVIRAL